MKRLRGFSTVTLGSGLGQLFLLASFPFLARLYEAADVGVFALALACAQIAGILVTLRVEQALPRVAAGRRCALLILCLLPATALGVAAGLAGWAVGGATGSFITSVAVLTVSVVVYNALAMVTLSVQDFSGLAWSRIANGAVTALLQSAGGFVAPSEQMLVWTYAVGSLAAVVPAVPALRRLWRERRRESIGGLWRAEGMSSFAGSVGPSALLSNLAIQLPLLVFAPMFGASVVGSFYLARKMLMVPTQLVASTVSEVGYALLVNLSLREIRARVDAWLRNLRWIALLVLLVGGATAPVAALVAGDQYTALGPVVLILTVSAAAQLVATSLSNVLLAVRAERVQLVWSLGRVLGLGVVLGACHLADAGYLLTVGVVSAYLTATYAVFLIVTRTTLARLERREAEMSLV